MPSAQTGMPSEQEVAIITGASQGIGAGAVRAYRKLGYAVVANSRHITSSDDPGVLTVPGDIYDLVAGVNLRGFFSATRPAITAMLRGASRTTSDRYPAGYGPPDNRRR